MIRRVSEASPATLASFDAIIDVRSPSEFRDDHLPGAVNLPVLSDEQRAEVGREYVRGSKFVARRRGARWVAHNIAAHLDGALSDKPAGFKPLIHCWRGGQRSQAMAVILDQVGWPVTVLEGGYRTWRRTVVAALYDEPIDTRFCLLDGPTGAGKTELLGRLNAQGFQTLDLEGLANHRGSIFGELPGGQPSQKLFDSRLFAALSSLDPGRPVVVEAEASRIGMLSLPASVWAAMSRAPVIKLEAPLEARIARAKKDYEALASKPERVRDLVGRLPRHHSKARRATWLEMFEAGDLDGFIRALMTEHYDPAYARAQRVGRASAVSAEDIDAVAAALRDAAG